MKYSISDDGIKDQIRKFVAGDEGSYSRIVSMLAQYIYNYARIVFGADEDTCGDFFEYVLSRFRDILSGYRESEAKFVTWFTVVLRNRYLNFIRAEGTKNRTKKEMDFVSLDCGAGDLPALHNILGDEKTYNSTENAEYENLIDEVVRNLKDRQRIFFHLYYVETLRPEDVGFISIHLGWSVREVLEGLEDIRSSIAEKYRLKNRLFQRLNDLYFQIIKNQKEGNESVIEKLKKKRNKVLEEYRRVKLNPSYESIGRFLRLPIGTVSTGIMRMRTTLRNYFEECYGEKMPV